MELENRPASCKNYSIAAKMADYLQLFVFNISNTL